MRIVKNKSIQMLEGMLDLNHANLLLCSGLGIKIHRELNSEWQSEIHPFQPQRNYINSPFGYIQLIAIRSE